MRPAKIALVSHRNLLNEAHHTDHQKEAESDFKEAVGDVRKRQQPDSLHHLVAPRGRDGLLHLVVVPPDGVILHEQETDPEQSSGDDRIVQRGPADEEVTELGDDFFHNTLLDWGSKIVIIIAYLS